MSLPWIEGCVPRGPAGTAGEWLRCEELWLEMEAGEAGRKRAETQEFSQRRILRLVVRKGAYHRSV